MTKRKSSSKLFSRSARGGGQRRKDDDSKKFRAGHASREDRALTSRLLTAQEEERKRISREIHDDLCQQLAAIVFDVGMLATERFSEATRGRLRKLETRLSHLSTVARNLAYRLHPSILTDLGLTVSLRALCEDAGQRNGMIVRFNQRGVPARLPIEVTSCLYRIAQEGLRNALQHSDAKHVVVTLAGNRGSITLSIQDDGIGFNPASLRKRGLGLASMTERMALVDGRLSIHSAPGLGTKVVATAPLSEKRS